MSHRVERYGPWLAAMAVGLSFLLFLLAGVYSVRQQSYVNDKLCEQTVLNRDGNRVTWNAARNLILRTSQNPDQINEFFDSILEVIPPLECIDNKPVVKEES